MHSLNTINQMNRRDNSIIIFSVEQSTKTNEQNAMSTQEALNMLRMDSVGFKELEGVYTYENGQTCSEASILVLDTPKNRQVVEDLCQRFNQECYLLSMDDRKSFLVYLDETRSSEHIGTLKAVSEHEAKQSDAYSYDPRNGTYWICK